MSNSKATVSFRTAHADAYRAARARSVKTDQRSLVNHWKEGREYCRWAENISDIAADVDISPSTVRSHMALYEMFTTQEALIKAANKFHCWSYRLLMRLASGQGYQGNHLTVWACAVCGSRELRQVTDEEEDAEPGGNVLAPRFKAAN